MVRVTVNLSEEDVAVLKELAARRQTTLTHVLRQSISSEKFIHEQKARGYKILLNKGRDFREVVFYP